MRRRRLLSIIKMVFFVSFILLSSIGMEVIEPETLRQKAQKEYKDGNYKNSLEIFQRLIKDPHNEKDKVGNDLRMAINCLRNLNQLKDIDSLLENSIEQHKNNWQLLQVAAEQYLYSTHYGYVISGQFERGYHRGGGKYVYTFDYDYTKCLQLMALASTKISDEDEPHLVANFYQNFANYIIYNRQNNQSWKLQNLTDLETVPDFQEGNYYASGTKGAPVDSEGNPVYYQLPEDFKSAKSDGERWLWALEQAKKYNPKLEPQIKYSIASFYHSQWGVQTLATYNFFWGGMNPTDEDEEKAAYAVHTLEKDETLAKLANGIKRFKLPEEANYIRLFQEIAEHNGSYNTNALDSLGSIFENRRQYKKAATIWKQRNNTSRYNQIVKNWGQFLPVMKQPAETGDGASVEFRFRNTEQIHFTAQEINTRKLIEDVKDYIRSRPNNLDWNKMQIENIGHRIVQQNQKQYLGKTVAEWNLEVSPFPNHFDKHITIQTPLKKAGAYLLTANLPDGNTSQIIIWLEDTVLLKKTLSDANYYFAADARTGKPIKLATIDFFGFKQKHIKDNRYQTLIDNFEEITNENGEVILSENDQPKNYQWLVSLENEEGRFAFLGMHNVWYSKYYDHNYNQTKFYFVTDRPVYRPNQPTKFKCWVRRAQYDMEDVSQFANKNYTIQIYNPKNEKVFEKEYTTDEYGGLNGEFNLPQDATLGLYRIQVKNHGRYGNFRVEEYKKPEFEVKVSAPSDPIQLGDTFEAEVEARYYFGEPVKNARVKYKVTREIYNGSWYPIGVWDWLYGSGYWWFAYDYTWYPGWYRWGCIRPSPWWWHDYRVDPPEIISEQELKIPEDGKLKIKIDTELAKVIHGDKDHQYKISVEVTDQSRRTITGSGNVLVSRAPFKIYSWVDKGHYRPGDTIKASFSAQTLDRKPVEGKGELRLIKISYDSENKPGEKTVQKWQLDTNPEGRAEIQINASEEGQFRLSYTLTDANEHEIEGGYIFNIIGKNKNAENYRFNHLELIPDKREYTPDETMNLLLNTNKKDSTVLLFTRPANSIYLKPQVISLSGRSHIEEIQITKRDMPNFYVEAVTVSNGKVHTEVREIYVPPEKRVLDVEVTPSSKEYKPGEEATVEVRVKDQNGNPVVGSIVMAVYDKALEYISGGSNISEIKEFFWKWRRRHNPDTFSNLQKMFHNLVEKNKTRMANLGVFGHLVNFDQNESDIALGREGSLEFFDGLSSNQDRRKRTGRSFKSANMRMAFAPAAADSLGVMSESRAIGQVAGAKLEEAEESKAIRTQTQEVQPEIRTNFADTAYWNPIIETDENGYAKISFKMPENLSGWNIKTWALSHGTKVGESSTEVVTKKNLLLRMQAPRFFVEKDEVVLSANVHNYLQTGKKVKVLLELEGGTLDLIHTKNKATELDISPDNFIQQITIDSGGEKRVDWRVKVIREGEAVIRMKALTDEESDAMEMRFPVYVHGMDKMVAYSGLIRPEQSVSSFTIDVPEQRRIDQSRLEIRYTPTLAGAMVDALPYLLDYPYGCTEQTLSRFIPAVITQKILLDMNLDLKAIKEKRTNLNAQEIGDPKERSKQWQRFDANPVFDEAEMQKIVKTGLNKIINMQVSDGGWGWFSGYGERSYPHTTAYVVHSLQIARSNGLIVSQSVLERGINWLKNYQRDQIQRIKNWDTEKRPRKRYADNLDAFVYMVLSDSDHSNSEMRDFLYRDRNHLSIYAKAMFAIAMLNEGQKEKMAMLQENIEQYLVMDPENQTAYLEMGNQGYWWYWYGSEIEAHAYYLKLLARVEPTSDKAAWLVKYLLNNRKHATYWNSTRDTAICIEALAEFWHASGEDQPDMTIEVWYDGQKKKEVQVNHENLFHFDNQFVLTGKEVTGGEHKIELRKKGKGPLYYNAYLSYFSLEDFIEKAGLEIKVNRKYFKLNRVDKTAKVAGSHGQSVAQKVEKYQREELKDLSTVTSGDLIEIELTIESKNDYEYLVFEDMKAAGFEPVDVRSGYSNNGLRAYMELRDNRVSFFTRTLPRGKHSISYRMRAEIPGKFSALPTNGYAMYAPELRANSDEIRIKILDKEF